MVSMPSAIPNGQQIDIFPGGEQFFEGDLSIVNNTNRLIKIAFDSGERQVDYQYRNAFGIEKSSNILLGIAIKQIVIRNAGEGIGFEYLLRNGA